MSKHLVTRVRHIVEGVTVDAGSTSEAIEKSRKLPRKDWAHIDSKRRRAYKAEALDVNTSARTR